MLDEKDILTILPARLAKYRSKSNPIKEHNIILAKDKTLYCDCWQWKKKRTCSHLEHYLEHYAHLQRRILHEEDDVVMAIDKAVSELKSSY